MSINFLAVLVAVVVKQGLGWPWCSPMLFGKSLAEASRRPLKLFGIQNGYLAVSLGVTGAILGRRR